MEIAIRTKHQHQQQLKTWATTSPSMGLSSSKTLITWLWKRTKLTNTRLCRALQWSRPSMFPINMTFKCWATSSTRTTHKSMLSSQLWAIKVLRLQLNKKVRKMKIYQCSRLQNNHKTRNMTSSSWSRDRSRFFTIESRSYYKSNGWRVLRTISWLTLSAFLSCKSRRIRLLSSSRWWKSQLTRGKTRCSQQSSASFLRVTSMRLQQTTMGSQVTSLWITLLRAAWSSTQSVNRSFKATTLTSQTWALNSSLICKKPLNPTQ